MFKKLKQKLGEEAAAILDGDKPQGAVEKRPVLNDKSSSQTVEPNEGNPDALVNQLPSQPSSQPPSQPLSQQEEEETDSTSRRQNLAAKLLLYGEEISEKNATILRLEEEVTQIRQQFKQQNDELRLTQERLTQANERIIELEQRAESMSGSEELAELKSKLSRSHSLTKSLDAQLHEREDTISVQTREIAQLKSSLEQNRHTALSELIEVSEGESGLRRELTSCHDKITQLEIECKTQSRLLSDSQLACAKLEQMLDSQLEKWKNEKEALSQSHDQQVGTLQATVNQLKSSLDKERQSSTDVKEELDSLREEALDRQIEDEKQISALHDTNNQLKAELRQQESRWKRETESARSEAEAESANMGEVNREAMKRAEEAERSVKRLEAQLTECQTLQKSAEEQIRQLQMGVDEITSRLVATETERDELLLRNANISSQLRESIMEVKDTTLTLDEERSKLSDQLGQSESALQTEKQRVADAEGEMARLQKELSTSQTIISQQEDTQQRMSDLETQVQEHERTIAEKTKTLRIQQQTISDLKKTIKRELKGADSGRGQLERPRDSSRPLYDRVKSSPALADLDRYDSPVEDNTPTAHLGSGPPTQSIEQQYKHEVNGFCGHKDINFEYLKNVIFKFLISRDSQSIHLTKAIATLLEFTPAEEKLLRETMEWKMSWWPTSKPRHQKKTRLLAYPSGDPR